MHMFYHAGEQYCYAVSNDGYSWERPVLGQTEFNGSTENNILPTNLPPYIFEDPSAPPEERFKAMGGRMFWADPETGEEIESEEAARRLKEEQGDLEYSGPRAEIHGLMSAWTSPDRKNWTAIERPLARRPVNGGISVGWDPVHQRYFAYIQLMGYPSEVIDGIGRSRHEDGLQVRAIGFTYHRRFHDLAGVEADPLSGCTGRAGH